jgi:ketosteroid isomerase-like protein
MTNITEKNAVEGTTLLRVRERTLHDFTAAWDSRDIDRLMQYMTEDCVYVASVGPESGRTYVGAAAVREGFREMLAYDADGESKGGRTFIAGHVDVAEWSYLKRGSKGSIVEVRGCDVLEFRGEKIARKDAFRKSW